MPDDVKALIDFILDDNPMHKKFIQSVLKQITAEELIQLSTYLDYSQKQGYSIKYMSECYLTIVEDTLREQMHFMKHKEYRNRSFSDVAGDIYFNDDYMNRYMFGLAITSFFWPNHLSIGRFFRETFPRDKKGRYLEIGPGHGYNFMSAMQLGKFDEYLGIDISETSINQTRCIIDCFVPELKSVAQLQLMDFLDNNDLEPRSMDAIVMGEVLEHVENPDIFLAKIAQLSKADSYIFISTCLNAPAVDHIYLWPSIDALEKMISCNGLNIKQSLYLPYEGKTMEEAIEHQLAINVAYVLEKNIL